MKVKVNKTEVVVVSKEVPTSITIELTPREALWLRVIAGQAPFDGAFGDETRNMYMALDKVVRHDALAKARGFLNNRTNCKDISFREEGDFTLPANNEILKED